MIKPLSHTPIPTIQARLHLLRGLGWEDIYVALKADEMPGVTAEGVRRWFFRECARVPA